MMHIAFFQLFFVQLFCVFLCIFCSFGVIGVRVRGTCFLLFRSTAFLAFSDPETAKLIFSRPLGTPGATFFFFQASRNFLNGNMFFVFLFFSVSLITAFLILFVFRTSWVFFCNVFFCVPVCVLILFGG